MMGKKLYYDKETGKLSEIGESKMHSYKVPLKELTKGERKEILEDLFNKKKENLEKQKEIIKKIEKELHSKKMKIMREEENLKHYRHLLKKKIL